MIDVLTGPTFDWRRLLGFIVSAVLGYRLLLVVRACDNYNLRVEHDKWYGEPETGDAVRLVLMAVVGSSSTNTPAFDTGSWPTGVSLFVDNGDRIAGRGGNGGKGGDKDISGVNNGAPGESGGTAMRVQSPLNVNNTGGIIAGGGGGAGGGGSARGIVNGSTFAAEGAGAGGGAGRNVGAGGPAGVGPSVDRDGDPGTLTAGGAGGDGIVFPVIQPGDTGGGSGDGGDGGDPGQAGQSGQSGAPEGGSGGAGGGPGDAIDGIANVTFVDANGDPTVDDGTILGPTS